MKKIIKSIFFTSALTASLILNTGDSLAASGSGTATATVFETLIVTKIDDLSFGSIIPSAAFGSISVNGSGTLDFGGATSIVDGTRGVYNVTGEAGETYSVDLPVEPNVLSCATCGGADMLVSVTQVNATGNTLIGGNGTFYINGFLVVGANQFPGVYTGTYEVSVNYE